MKTQERGRLTSLLVLMAMLLTACAGIIPGPSAAGPTATSAPAATVTVEPPAAPL